MGQLYAIILQLYAIIYCIISQDACDVSGKVEKFKSNNDSTSTCNHSSPKKLFQDDPRWSSGKILYGKTYREIMGNPPK